jgi:hypothetical protein
MLRGRSPTTTDAEKSGGIARLAPYRDGAVFASKFAGSSDWERHSQGDEIVQILDGATTLHVITEDGRQVRGGRFSRTGWRASRKAKQWFLYSRSARAHPHPLSAAREYCGGLGPRARSTGGSLDLIAVFSAEEHVADFKPNLKSLRDLPLRAVIVTAPGSDMDFVSRWFAPKQGEGESTGVTGSAHCSLVPYWAQCLGRTRLKARQLPPRGGIVDCELKSDRVWLSCTAAKYMQGYLYL